MAESPSKQRISRAMTKMQEECNLWNAANTGRHAQPKLLIASNGEVATLFSVDGETLWRLPEHKTNND